MRLATPALIASLALVFAGGARAEAVDDPDARYQALLREARAKAPDADWLALRIAYSERRAFRVVSDSAARRRMLEAADRADCAVALAAARARLDEAFVDVDAHLVAAYCEDQAGEAAAAQLDRDIGAGLVKSIETGDGLSPAGAFTPIDVDVEYSVKRAMGLKVTGQILVVDHGRSYDSLSTVDQTGKAGAYYFLIDRMLALESAALAPGALSEGGPPGRSP